MSLVPSKDDIKILKKYCEQHYLSGGIKQNEDATYIPSLDHSIYQEELILKTGLEEFPVFSQLDDIIHREQRKWKINKVQDESLFIVRPIDNFNDLKSFEGIDSPFCFFSKNIAQLYLYAAHQFTRLLGVWSLQNGIEKPEGVLPFLMLRDEQHYPWLYLEAAMLTENILMTEVKTTSNIKIPFSEALLKIIEVYVAIQETNLFPAIGTTQKNGSLYGPALKAFLEPAARQFGSLSYANSLEYIKSNGEGKPLMKAKYEGKVRLELPEDETFNNFLKENGHPIDYMFSYAFLQDENRKIYVEEGGRKTGWGEMQGETEFVPLLDYIPIYNEKRKQQMVQI